MNSTLQNAAIEQPQHSIAAFQKSAIAQAAGVPFCYLSRAEVIAICGISQATLYRLIAEGAFPVGDLITLQSRRWKSTDVTNWLECQSILSKDREASAGADLKHRAKKAVAKRFGGGDHAQA